MDGFSSRTYVTIYQVKVKSSTITQGRLDNLCISRVSIFNQTFMSLFLYEFLKQCLS